jgi:hypothetical protein
MKPTFCYLFLVSIIWTSCTTYKQFDNRAKASRESSYETAIIKRDGTIVTGQTLKHKITNKSEPYLFSVLNTDNAISLDNKNYNDTDVVFFQDQNAFYKQYENVFLIRLLKGKINLYYFDIKKLYNHHMSAASGQFLGSSSQSTIKSIFFLEKGKYGITEIDITELRKAVSDNPKALDKLNSYYPKSFYTRQLDIEKIVSVIELYNQ